MGSNISCTYNGVENPLFAEVDPTKVPKVFEHEVEVVKVVAVQGVSP